MYAMNGVTFVKESLSIAYAAGSRRIVEHQRLAAVIVSTLATVAFIYQRLNRPDVLPFDRWTASLGIFSQAGLTRVDDLQSEKATYSPAEFVRRSVRSLKADGKAGAILPPNQQSLPLSLEDENAAFIQRWSMSLRPVFAFIQDNSLPWKNLLQPLQSSPRLAYTILFDCLAPFAAKAIWEGVKDSLPTSLQEMEKLSIDHKGKIAVGALVLIAWIYHRMNQEKGIITHLTENYASFRKMHRGLDLVPSVRRGIDHLLRTMGTTKAGEHNSNIVWFYDNNSPRTFVDQMGDILAEMTATGRMYESSDLMKQFPQLENPEIVELDLAAFLTEYRDKNEVYRGWHEALKHLTKSGNILVVLRGLDLIKPFFLSHSAAHRNPEGGPSEPPPFRGPESDCKEILTQLLIQAIQQGKFRCLIECAEHDKNRMESEPFFSRFTAMRAPDVSSKELEEVCVRLFTGFAQEDIHNLFRHLEPVLSKNPLPFQEIMDTLQGAQREQESSWRRQVQDSETIRKIDQAERELLEVEQMKLELLQKLWVQRRLQTKESQTLLDALNILEHQLLPLYRKAAHDLKKPSITPADLVSEMQKRFTQLFGPSTPAEKERLQTLPGRLKKKIQGQDVAVDAICKAVSDWRRVPPLDGKPLVLFFAGSPGIGKSETATQLAFELNSTYGITETAGQTLEANVRRINLNRKSQGGFLGWDKAKAEIQLQLLGNPTSVIILEEWDKMESGDRSSLLELLDGIQSHMNVPWSISSDNGEFVSKSCATFVLTSNVETGPVDAVRAKILAYFDKEKDGVSFLSRIDGVIPFQDMSEMANRSLVSKYLDEYTQQGVLPADKRVAVEQRLQRVNTTDTRELQRQVREAIAAQIS